jgi:hypothetical protein
MGLLMVQGLEIWAVYDHPKDFPDRFVARKFIYDRMTDKVITAPDLTTLRTHFQQRGLCRLPRDPSDDPVIVECWI